MSHCYVRLYWSMTDYAGGHSTIHVSHICLYVQMSTEMTRKGLNFKEKHSQCNDSYQQEARGERFNAYWRFCKLGNLGPPRLHRESTSPSLICVHVPRWSIWEHPPFTILRSLAAAAVVRLLAPQCGQPHLVSLSQHAQGILPLPLTHFLPI